MMRTPLSFSYVLAALAIDVIASTASATEPHTSARYLPSANGRASIAWDTQSNKLSQLLEHPYRYPSAGVQSRNFAFDSYPGLRIGNQSAWLNGVAPLKVEYLPGTGVVHVVRNWQGVTVEEHDFAPMGLTENAAFTVLKVTRTSGSGAISAYQLFNYHLGAGSPSPDSNNEGMAWNAQRDAFYEWGPSGVALGYGSIGASSHHGCSPNNPYSSLLAQADLADNAGTSQNDAIAGLEASLGDLAVNATATVGWFSVLAPDAQAAAAIDRVRTWIGSRGPQKLLDDEVADWTAWQKAAPNGSTALESRAWSQAQAVLRMGQVSATDSTDGQILASVAPGQWNIAWVRDMSYATVALARSGHLAEAKRAIAFQLSAKTGAYQSYVGAPYQISVVRYYGNGTEESDTNADGPNVEFDGFGLFLWELEEYVKASGDTAFLDAAWPAVKSKVADPLVALQEPTGLIAPDSSIWEVHWNGKQKHFAYTTITAAQGLCSASRLALQEKDPPTRTKYLVAGQKARDAIYQSLRAPDGTIAQATESLAANVAWLDAAAVEAIGFGLFDAKKHTAKATLDSLAQGLVPPSGRGYMRNDSGGWYDSQEWIFVDLRGGHALDLGGRTAQSAPLLDWNVNQAAENYGLFAELHERVTSDYAGEVPMVGFGAGAFSLALLDRGKPAVMGCEAYVDEPAEPVDAGPDAPDASGPLQDAAADATDGGKALPIGGADFQEGCSVGFGGPSTTAALLVSVCLAGMVIRRRKGLALAATLSLMGCSSAETGPSVGPPRDAGLDASDTSLPTFDAGPIIDNDGGACMTTFTFRAPAGHVVKSVSVAGEWNQFMAPGTSMTPDQNGVYSGEVALAPGWYGYKLIVDGNWQLDPAAKTRKYVTAVENSGVTVKDCYSPTLSLVDQSNSRMAPMQGHYMATVAFHRGQGGTQLDASSVSVAVKNDFATLMRTANVDEAAETVAINLTGLSDGKYTLFVAAKDRRGRGPPPLRLVFWIESSTFEWRDALIYMAMTDRFRNGDVTNDVQPVKNVDLRANFQNGDLEGVRQVIASGALDQLGVRALWLTPFQTNPQAGYPSDDGVHDVTGYHGYWPVKAREVEPRLGGDKALEAMVKEAHAHGIRVLMDFVVNHVHENHEYFKAHPEWFRTGCVCGTNNCDWTTHRLDCLFAPYMPDVNWTVADVSRQFTDDAVYWIDRFDLDGLRVDAVKHVEDAAIYNLSARVRGEFEASGNKVFLTGETAMGWSDCGLACNQAQYDTISRYIGPGQLDGQFDFVLYHAVPYRTFDADQHGLLHADYWAQASTWMYPQGSVMTPYIGSHDTPRSVTLATYRGQDGAHDPSTPGNKWSNIAAAPNDPEPYARHRAALSWLMGLPGAPLLYYGDEYGEWGGADPNNRVQWRGDEALTPDESATLALTRKLGAARRDLVALRRGDYRHVQATETLLLFARQTTQGDVALVAISKDPSTQSFTAALPITLSLADGTVLHDRLGGPDVTVVSGTVSLTLPSRGAAILAP